MTSPRLTERSMGENCKANFVSEFSDENAWRRDRISRASFTGAFHVASRNARGVAVCSNKRPVGADCYAFVSFRNRYATLPQNYIPAGSPK
jgi:hypothetical protein